MDRKHLEISYEEKSFKSQDSQNLLRSKSFIDIMWTEDPFEHFCEHLESFSIGKAFKAILYLFNGQKTFFRSHINMGALKVKIFKINCCQKGFLMYFVDKS